MNIYGRQAHAYWKRWLPEQYAEINDPEDFFTGLGDQVRERVRAAWDEALATDDPSPDERRADRVERLAALKRRTEGGVLREMVFHPPEPPTGPPEEVPDWRVQMCAALLDGHRVIDELSDADLKTLIDYATPEFLLAIGTSVEEQRARGRPI